MNALTRILSLPAVGLSRIPGLGPLVRACSTSVGQKIVMAITGLSLCGFLVVHLGGNLLLYAGEEKFNAYAHALHSQGALLKVAEVGLFSLFAAHLGLAVSTGAMSRVARSQSYAMKESKQGIFALPAGGASAWMGVTGILIGIFLITHLLDLRLKVNPLVKYPAPVAASEGQIPELNEFEVVRTVLSSPINAVVYFIGIFALGIHLTHGLRSAFQSLGLNGRRWDSFLKCGSLLFGWVIAAGFISLIFWSFAVPR